MDQSLVDGSHALERIVEGEDVLGSAFLPGIHEGREHHRPRAIISAPESSATRMIDQDASHEGRGQREERGPIVQRQLTLRAQPEVDLVDQSGRLESMMGSLGAQGSARQTTQLFVDRR